MRFGSVCSGIEAASVAWHPLGWQAAWLSEIEPFPCAVLKHHYPDVPNLGDMTALPERILSGEVEAPDLFCGGTPCQAFSVAGLRNSLNDARGNLSLTFVGIANAIDHVRSVRGDDPAIIFWENVPGVLSTKDNAFGCFLGALAGEDDPLIAPGGKWTNAGCVYGPQRAVAWRVLDAQYFGVAQRRRRVFVVASARDGFDPVSVLFEFDGVRRDIAPSRETGQAVAGGAADGAGVGQPYTIGNTLTARMHKGMNSDCNEGQTPVLTPVGVPDVMATLTSSTAGVSRTGNAVTEHETYIPMAEVAQPVTYDFFNITAPINRQSRKPGDPAHTLARTNAEHAMVMQPIPIDSMNHIGRGDHHSFGDFEPGAPSYTLTKGHSHAVAQPIAFNIAPGKGDPNENATAAMQPITFGAQMSTPQTDVDMVQTLQAKNPMAVAQPVGVDIFNAALTGDVAVPLTHRSDGTGTGPTIMHPVIAWDEELNASIEQAGTLLRGGDGGRHDGVAVAYDMQNDALNETVFPTIQAEGQRTGNRGAGVLQVMQVRRLTPVECERLQGFPDNYTNIPWRKKPEAPDGPRYKALGNSWAVPNVRWIGQRIAEHLKAHP